MRTLAEEMAAPKYAHLERERRWLVDRAARPGVEGCECLLIEDRYILNSRLRLRRMTDVHSGDVTVKLTKKYEAADPLARPIVTSYLTEEEFGLFLAMPHAPLRKHRYQVDGFSLDVFADAHDGLELAEIEAERDALASIAAPAWTLREVSHDPRYQGGALACGGLPEN